MTLIQQGVAAPGMGMPAGAPGRGPGYYASPVGLDRIVRREVMLGLVREIVPPQSHIGLQLVPWMEVPTDDVIFSYAQGYTDGLVPARSEDAEAELAQKDDTFLSEGRASVIDWAVKDHYVPGDVSRYREWLLIREQVRDLGQIPLFATGSVTGDFQRRLARDTERRRRKIDNRLEWLIMSSFSTGAIAYNDGRIKFSVDWGRPAGQQALAPTGTLGSYTMGAAWTSTSADPIGDIQKIQQYMWDTYNVRITRALTSRKVLNSIMNSDRFIARSGLVVGGTPSSTLDIKYVVDGWGPTAAQAIVEQQTGVVFTEYDSVYRTRPIGSNTVTNNRFLPDNRIVFLPDEADIAEFDDTDLGFGKMLTSPHPAGNWTPGYYAWEFEYGVDPWGLDMGTGVKAFPVLPHMDKTLTYDPVA
jgi:hypothetical protein